VNSRELTIGQCCDDYASTNIVREIKSGKVSKEFNEEEKPRYIKCRFLDNSNNPKGREYTYGTLDNLEKGDFVETEEGKKLIVTSLNVPSEEGEKWGNLLSSVKKCKEAIASIDTKEPELIDFEDKGVYPDETN
jgi:hypothetical protein